MVLRSLGIPSTINYSSNRNNKLNKMSAVRINSTLTRRSVYVYFKTRATDE